MDDLTLEEILHYLKNGGKCCPYCDKEDIHPDGSLRFDDATNQVYQAMGCKVCGGRWLDWFKLSGVTPLSE